MTRFTTLALAVGFSVAAAGTAVAVETVPGMPPVVDPVNLYSETMADKLSPAVAKALPRVYVPNLKSNDVTVIDPATLKVVDRFPVGVNPQHVVPSWDLTTLWVTNNAEHRTDGTLTPIDPVAAAATWSTPPRSRRLASSRPALAPTDVIPAGMGPCSTSPTGVRLGSAGSRAVRAASRSSISRRAGW